MSTLRGRPLNEAATIVFPFPVFGGAEDYATLLAAGLLERGWRVTAVFPEGVEPPAGLRALPDLGAGSLEPVPLSVMNSPWRLRAALARLPAGVVHVNNAFVPGIAAAASLGRDRPGVVTNHTPALEGALSWKGRALAVWAAPRVDWIVPSRRAAELQGRRLPRSRRRVHVIPRGLPRERFPDPDQRAARGLLRLPPEAFVAGCVGRISRPARHDLLVRAAALARERVPTLVLVVVGDGELRAEVEALAEAELPGRVVFAGHRDDVPALLPAFDVFCVASDADGLSSTLLEAMAMERPIVATDVPGTAEALEDGLHGLLVAGGDPEPLAAAIVRLAHEPELASRLGRHARDRFLSHFTVDLMVERTIALYRLLLEGR